MENTEAKRNIKLIAFDLDGTTLHGFAELSERNPPRHGKGERRRHSGRPGHRTRAQFYSAVPHRAAVYPLRHHLKRRRRVGILENKVLCTDLIPTETALEVQKIFDDYELYVEYYVHGRGVTKRGNPDKARTIFGFPEEKYYFLTKDYTFTDNLSVYLKETHAEPEKINMMFIPESVRPEILARLQKLGGIELTFSNVDNIEINKKGCDKGTALYSLCKVLGIDPKNTMAAGDNGNDLGMLKAAGFAAVVGNGIEEAKAIADAVVAPCIEDGFAEAVERFALR